MKKVNRKRTKDKGLGTGQGMTKDQWEDQMTKLFLKILQGSPLGKMLAGMTFDESKTQIIVRYGQEPLNIAGWDMIMFNQLYDNVSDKFLTPMHSDESVELKKGICPGCGQDVMAEIRGKQIRKEDQMIGPLIINENYEVCKNCETRVMHSEMELIAVHDTEIIFLTDILSAPLQIKGKMHRLRDPQVYVLKVNGKHPSWNEGEVRKMMISMAGEIVELWMEESAVAFDKKLKEVMSEN